MRRTRMTQHQLWDLTYAPSAGVGTPRSAHPVAVIFLATSASSLAELTYGRLEGSTA